jgi:large subunit ribosomal protein L3
VSIGILGTKLGMAQIFNQSGNSLPVTIIKVGPCIVTQIKTLPSDGSSAIQVGYLPINKKTANKPYMGHFKKVGVFPTRLLREFRVTSTEDFQLGQLLTVDDFRKISKVDISGRSIGRGFQGCQKRHHFTRGPMTHGSKNHRRPGSIGQGSTPGRVFPGKKMAGQLGNKSVTVKKLNVIHVDSDKNILVIKGAVPGKTGSLLKIQAAL